MRIIRYAGAFLLPVALLTACSDSTDPAAVDASATAAASADPTQGTAQPAPIPTGAVTPSAAADGNEESVADGDLAADWLEPVELEQPVAVDDAATVAIGELRSEHLDAQVPGEVSGDGIVVPVTVANTGSQELSLAGLVVTVSAGEADAPASQIDSASDEVPASLAPGQAVTIEMAYVVPQELRDKVNIVVDLGAQSRAAVFTGAAPTA